MLLGAICLLSSCGSPKPTQTLSESFLAQETVASQIHSNMIFSTVSPDSEEGQLCFTLTGTATTDLNSQCFYLDAELTHQTDDFDPTTTEVESYYDPEQMQSYSRFGSHYSVTGENTGFVTLVRMPLSLHLDDHYLRQEESELIGGCVCDVYVGSERSTAIDLPVYAHGSLHSLPLSETPIEVRLAVDPSTSLPVKLTLTYLPKEAEPSCFTGPNGTKYTLSELNFEVIYQHYGLPVDTTIPDGFREQALAPEPANTPEPMPASEPPEPRDSYFIQTADHRCRYQISTPQYTAPESVTESTASFYYFYSEEDFEVLEYNLWDDFTPQDAAAYTKSLPQQLRETGTYGNLSSSKIKELRIDDKTVQYRVLRFQTAENDLLYDGMLVYSWCSTPDEEHVLEVVLWEYNASGTRSFFQPEEELCYAYHYAAPMPANSP